MTEENKSICPLMSRPVVFDFGQGERGIDTHFVRCQGSRCQFWVHVYTTEQIPTSGCAIELSPTMHDGLYRV